MRGERSGDAVTASGRARSQEMTASGRHYPPGSASQLAQPPHHGGFAAIVVQPEARHGLG
ncbi:MAG: hypothetical protein ABW207_03190 [Stenotrophomonas chelatiphaga]